MQLVVRSKSSTAHFSLDSGDSWEIGRHPENDITLDDPKASRHHGHLTIQEGVFFYKDLGTGNGSKISGVSVPPNTPIEIKEEDVIEIGEFQLQITTSENHVNSFSKGTTGVLTLLDQTNGDREFVLGNETNLIGRLPVCQIEIDDPGSSRINSEILLEGTKYYLRDLGSANGTFLNDEEVKKEVVRPGDVIRIGSHRFEFSYSDRDVEAGGEYTDPGLPDPEPGKVNLSPGCNTITFGLITAIISGAVVFFYMSKTMVPVEKSSGGTSGLNGDSNPNNKNAPVEVSYPLITDLPVTLGKNGNVKLARQDIILLPPGEKVTEVHVENGQRVQKGEALVTFEMTEELRSAKKQATAGLNQANEDVAKAESEVTKALAVLDNAKENLSIIQRTHDRSLRLYRNGNLLQKEWDEILVNLAEARTAVRLREADREQAKRSVTQAQEKVVQVQTDLDDVEVLIDDLTVTANSNGVVNRLDLKDGYTVTAVNSSMELIEYEKEVKVVASVSEDDITFIRDRMAVDVWLPRAQNQKFRGKVSFIPPTAVNRNYNVEILVPNRKYHFRPGQQVSVQFIGETRDDAILVLPSALDTNSQTGYFVFKVDPGSKIAEVVSVDRGQDVTHEKVDYIEIMPVQGDHSIVKTDLIITKGNKAVKQGMKVEIQNLDESSGLPK